MVAGLAMLAVAGACSDFGDEDAATGGGDAGPAATEASTTSDAADGGGDGGDPKRPRRTLVVIGGLSASASDRVFLGTIEPSGIAWAEGGRLPEPRASSCAFSTGERLYVVGGYALPTVLGVISRPVADANAAWRPETGPATARQAHACAVIGDALHVVGGGGPFSASQLANVDSATAVDGGLVWTQGQALPSAVQTHAVEPIGDTLYSLGGAPCRSAVLAGATESGRVKSWSDAGSLPTPRYAAASASSGDRIYLSGGLEGPSCATASAAVSSLRIQGGAIESIAAERSLPEARVGHRSVIVGSRLFVIGGRFGGTGGAPARSVMSAEVNADGTLGAWTDEDSLPDGVSDFALIVL